MPKDVLDLIPEVIAHCQVCKKYSKVSSRPRVRGRHVDVFNQELQADIFFLWEEPIDSAGIIAVAGAAQDNLSVFERALRLRQLAMTAATQSIMESRIARAAKTRPQQFDLTNFKPGITEVEFHREGAGDYGWRGPATLLKISEDQGTACASRCVQLSFTVRRGPGSS